MKKRNILLLLSSLFLLAGCTKYNGLDPNEDPKPVEHVHTFAKEWSHDENKHWHAATCEHTEEKSNYGDHDYGDDDVCDTCGYTKAAPTPSQPSVNLNMSSLTLVKGNEQTLSASRTEGLEGDYVWSVEEANPEGCVSVDQTGKVTANELGTAKVVVSLNDLKASCSVSVTDGSEPEPIPEKPEVTGVTVDVSTVTVAVDGRKEVIPEVLGKGDYSKSIIISSSNSGIARASTSLSSGGVSFYIEGVSEGTCTIYVSSSVNKSIKASISVTVTGKEVVETVSFAKSSYEICQKETISVLVNATNLPVYTVSGDNPEAIQIVSSSKTGLKVKGLSAGSAVITATLGTATDSCTITVSNEVLTDKTYYFENNYCWTDLKYYVYGDSIQPAWEDRQPLNGPVKDINGNDAYYFSVPADDTYSTAIITGVDGTYGESQTVNISLSMLTGNYFKLSGWDNGKASVVPNGNFVPFSASVTGIDLSQNNVQMMIDSANIDIIAQCTGVGDYDSTLDVNEISNNCGLAILKNKIENGLKITLSTTNVGTAEFEVYSVTNPDVKASLNVTVLDKPAGDYVILDKESATIQTGEKVTFTALASGAVTWEKLPGTGDVNIVSSSNASIELIGTKAGSVLLNAKIDGVVLDHADITVTENENIKKIYFTNNYCWENVSYYAYGDNGTNADWPGIAFNDKQLVHNDREEDCYFFDLDLSKYHTFIVAGYDKGKKADVQTVDIKYEDFGENNNVYLDGWTTEENPKANVRFAKFNAATPVVETLEVSKSSVSLYNTDGASATIEVTLTGKFEFDKTFNVVSNDTSVCVTDKLSGESGDSFTITPTGVGDTTVLVSSVADPSIYKEISVTVSAVPEKYCEFDEEVVKVMKNDSVTVGVSASSDVTYDIVSGDSFINITNQTNTGITLSGVASGTAVIKATSDGIETTLTVKVQEKISVYVTDNLKWGTMKMYAFGENEAVNAQWPGVDAISSYWNNDGENHQVFKFELLTNEYTYIVFNNNDGKQTIDISLTGVVNNSAWWIKDSVDGSGHNEVGSWTYQATHKYYLNTGGSSLWEQGGAKFSAYYWDKDNNVAATSVWLKAVAGAPNKYEVELPAECRYVIFIRNTDKASNPGFDDKWNQTEDLTTQTDNKTYIIDGWGSNGVSTGHWGA